MSEDLYGITPYPINLDNGSDVVFQLQLSCYPATSFFLTAVIQLYIYMTYPTHWILYKWCMESMIMGNARLKMSLKSSCSDAWVHSWHSWGRFLHFSMDVHLSWKSWAEEHTPVFFPFSASSLQSVASCGSRLEDTHTDKHKIVIKLLKDRNKGTFFRGHVCLLMKS